MNLTGKFIVSPVLTDFEGADCGLLLCFDYCTTTTNRAWLKPDEISATVSAALDSSIVSKQLFEGWLRGSLLNEKGLSTQTIATSRNQYQGFYYASLQSLFGSYTQLLAIEQDGSLGQAQNQLFLYEKFVGASHHRYGRRHQNWSTSQ